MKTSKKVLSQEVQKALNVDATDAFLTLNHKSTPGVMLVDAINSVAAIPAAAMPTESTYHIVANALAGLFRECAKKHGGNKTMMNNITMVQNATISELDRKAKRLSTEAIAVKAAAAADAKPTKANVAKAARTEKAADKAAAVKTPTSLDAASKAGIAAARRKTSKIVVRQAKANKAGKSRKPKPTKLEAAKAVETRKAVKELFLQSVDNALDVLTHGDAMKAADVLVAFKALTASSKAIVEYLPADMRTL